MPNFINFQPGEYIKTLAEEGVDVYFNRADNQIYFLTPVNDSFKFEAGLMIGPKPESWVRFTYSKTKTDDKTSTSLLIGTIQYTYDQPAGEPIEASFTLQETKVNEAKFQVSLPSIENPTNGDIKLEAGILLFKQMFKAGVFQQARERKKD